MTIRMSIARCCCITVPPVDPLTYLANNHAWNMSEHDYTNMPAIPLPLVAGNHLLSPAGVSAPEDYFMGLDLANGTTPDPLIVATATGSNSGGIITSNGTLLPTSSINIQQSLGYDPNADTANYPNRSGGMSAPKSSQGATVTSFVTIDSGTASLNPVNVYNFGLGEISPGIGGCRLDMFSQFNRWVLTRSGGGITNITNPLNNGGPATWEVVSGATPGVIDFYFTDSNLTRVLVATYSGAFQATTGSTSLIRHLVPRSLSVYDKAYQINTGVVTVKALGAWTISDGDWSEAAGTITMDNSGKSVTAGGVYKPDERYNASQTVTLAADTLHRISWDTSGTDYGAIPAVAIDDVCISRLPDATFDKSKIDRLGESYFFKTNGTGSAKIAFYQWSQKNSNISNIKIEELT